MDISLTGTALITVSTVLKCSMPDACSSSVKSPLYRDRVAVTETVLTYNLARNTNQIALEELSGSSVAIGDTIDQAEQKDDPLTRVKYGSIPAHVKLNVPFTSQAPHQNWDEPYNEACEEASLAMVEYYIQGRQLTSDTADAFIKYLVALEERKGWGIDISTSQVAEIASQTYLRETYRYIGTDVTLENLKRLLAGGYPVIIPVAGQDLSNPNFIGDGPPYHMIVLTGYNADNFYAHDPGTQYGEHYEYPQSTIMYAIHEWTGSKSSARQGEKAILVIDNPNLDTYIAYNF